MRLSEENYKKLVKLIFEALDRSDENLNLFGEGVYTPPPDMGITFRIYKIHDDGHRESLGLSFNRNDLEKLEDREIFINEVLSPKIRNL